MAGAADSYPGPLSLTGNLSIVRDPCIAFNPSESLYYLFSTGTGIPIRTASSLTGPWEFAGSVFQSGCAPIDNKGACTPWAPDIQKSDEAWYLSYAVSTLGSQNSSIGYATTGSLSIGNWTSGSELLLSVPGDPYNAIDPNVIFQADGKSWLTFGSYWGDVYQAELDEDGSALKVESAPVQISYNATGPHAEEGPFVYPKNNWFYLFYSEGLCCDATVPAGNAYKIFVGRSDSINGPYTDANGVDLRDTGGTLVLTSHDAVYSPGGQSVFLDPVSGRDVMVYHYSPIENPTEYTLGINYLSFDTGWPVVVS